MTEKPRVYKDKFVCYRCDFTNTVTRRKTSMGKIVDSYCRNCKNMVKVKANAK